MPITSNRTTTHDPDILDLVKPDVAKRWAECKEASDHIQRPDGSTAWGAAMAADPGLTACPACGAYHWNIGRWHRCRECAFVYPADAWAMFSWGRHAAAMDDITRDKLAALITRRMPHPYYKWGFDHYAEAPHQDPWVLFHKLDWKLLLPGSSICDLTGVY